MRISDWSSDVCSSDLRQEKGNDFMEGNRRDHGQTRRRRIALAQSDQRARVEIAFGGVPDPPLRPPASGLECRAEPQALRPAFPRRRRHTVVACSRLWTGPEERTSAVEGESGAVRVEVGG